MKHLVEAEQIQALWLGNHHAGRTHDLVDDLAVAVGRLDDRQVLDALETTCRMDVAVDRLDSPACDCADPCAEDDLGQCPTLTPALASAGRQMMGEACESIRGWNLMFVNGGYVAAGVADDSHYTGAILIGQIEPLADRS